MLRSVIGDDVREIMSLLEMLAILSDNSFAAFGNLAQSSHMLASAREDPGVDATALKGEYFDVLAQSLAEIERVSAALNFDATLAAIVDCKRVMGRGVPFNGGMRFEAAEVQRLGWLVHNVRSNFSAQMGARYVMVLGGEHTVFLTSDAPPFGDAVQDAFPKASEEISEAAKCLALKRNTASVFHLMRAMELAVQRLAVAIETGKSIDKEWGKLLSDIGAAIEAMPKGPERDQWSQSHSLLYHCKQAWRNDTMHPKTTYTDDEAKTVFEAVKSFMVHLAPLID